MKLHPLDIHTRRTLLLIAATGLARLVIAAFTGLGYGESYYFRGALNPALSYFDQPPLFFWLGGLSIRLLGTSAFALRLPTVLMFAGTCWMLFLAAKQIYSTRAGFHAVLMLNLSFVFTLSVGTWFQPDGPLMFFWMAATLLSLHLASRSPGTRFSISGWLLLGLLLGLAMLSKYHAVFLFAGLLGLAVQHRTCRAWLKTPWPYAALAIALLISLPILAWNAEHGWTSFSFQGSRAGSADPAGFALHPLELVRSIAGQAVWTTPWIWLPLVLMFPALARRSRTHPPESLLFWQALLPVVFFTLVALWTDIGHHFHWQAPGYLLLFIPLGHWIAERWERSAAIRRWVIATAICTLLPVAVLSVHTETGFWKTLGPGWVAKKLGHEHSRDPTLEGYDYDDLADRAQREGWLDNTNLFMLTDNWKMAGKIDWALKGRLPVHVANPDPRNYLYYLDPQIELGKDAVFICYSTNIPIHWISPFFQSLEKIPPLSITRGGEQAFSRPMMAAKHFQVPAYPVDFLPLYHRLTETK